MDIHKVYVIEAPRDAVWAALTDPTVIERWGGGPVVMSAEAGCAFEFWGGDIHGTVLEVDPGHAMLQEWYGGDWDTPSLVRFTLTEDPDGATRLELEHTGVPSAEAASFDAGWDDYYVGPLKAMLEAESAS
jgi:uncharacterized protein YndB with AHSA1/START domain